LDTPQNSLLVRIGVDLESFLATADGRIKCARCTAISKRNGLQCGRPAMRLSKTQKCNFHGGKSTGPKTEEGRKRISTAQLIHGRETVKKRAVRQESSVRLAQMEDVMHVLGMTTGGRTRGPKPNGYHPIVSLDQVHQWVIDDYLRPNNPLKETG
jgi:hypothetical protein